MKKEAYENWKKENAKDQMLIAIIGGAFVLVVVGAIAADLCKAIF